MGEVLLQPLKCILALEVYPLEIQGLWIYIRYMRIWIQHFKKVLDSAPKAQNAIRKCSSRKEDLDQCSKYLLIWIWQLYGSTQIRIRNSDKYMFQS
jgi:hypothetical protein